MPRRTRLTSQKPKKRAGSRKSKSKNGTLFDEDQDPPSEATWATMAPYRSFVGVQPFKVFPKQFTEHTLLLTFFFPFILS